ncbi:MAG: S1 family peptidase [Calothrix sp. SM1_5_4]|nr:S1 family peptidase [Calothrix sp. SM1_5_4]
MRNVIYVLLTCFLTATVGGCTLERGPRGQSAQPRIPFYKLKCADPASCSPSVGVLYIRGPISAALCTGSVVGELNGRSLILTNKHCVHNLAHDPLRCPGTVIEFPEAGGHPREGARCASVLGISPDTLNLQLLTGRDYAFILLDRKVRRPTLQITSRDLPDDEPLTFHHLDASRKASGIRFYPVIIAGRSCTV